MQVIHPNEAWKNVHPDNVFDVVNDHGVRCGRGYVVYQYQPAIYPDKPVRIFFEMECTPEAQYMLFGALIAQARRLRQQNPNEGAYVYTSVDPQDTRMLNFCLYNGMTVGNSEELVRLYVPQDGGQDVFGYQFGQIPLGTLEQQNALIARMTQNGLPHLTQPYLQALTRNPVCVPLGVFYAGNSMPVGECIISGAPGSEPELVGIYVAEGYRGSGVGKRLLRRALSFCAPYGVPSVQARIMAASQPQSRLMRAFGGDQLSQTLLFPGMEL